MNTRFQRYAQALGVNTPEGDKESLFWAAWANPEEMAKRARVELPGAGEAADTQEGKEFYCDWS